MINTKENSPPSLPESLENDPGKLISDLTDSDITKIAIWGAWVAGVRGKHLRYSFDGYHKEVDVAVQQKGIRCYAQKCNTIILGGPVGTGKTGMLVSMIKEQIGGAITNIQKKYTGETVIARHVVSIIANKIIFANYKTMTAVFRDKIEDEYSKEIFRGYQYTPLLVIDDFLDGTFTQWDAECLGQIISARHAEEYPLWLSTNKSSVDMKQLPGFERSVSRLIEMSQGETFVLTGEDRRQKK